ncbi:MAG: hypothetical protein AAB562_02075 [Patescibacteria group bacterium]
MSAKAHNSRKRISKALAVFADIAESYDYIFNPNWERRPSLQSFDAYQEWKVWKAWKLRRKQLHYLKRTQLIEAQKIGERLMVRLTEKGYRKMLQIQLRSSRRKCVEGVCLVSFDIPESQKAVRDAFRGLLRECGFQKLHHSVWFTENDVSEPLLAFVKMNKLTSWVHVFVGKIASMERR